ncbi:MAG: hypothetical protein ABWK53_01865 [Anaerolineales bacterium]
MSAPRFAVQYLENRPAGLVPAEARARLRQAFDRLPIEAVLLGWDLPPAFEEAVAAETRRAGARLFRWQPLLTGTRRLALPPEWAVIGADGAPVPGHGGQAEFTFICPNRSAVAEFVAERIETVAARGLFDGVFLDRIRFPSPAPNPTTHLGCFCRACTRLAADSGLDLETARRALDTNPLELARALLGAACDPPLAALLDFRQRSITRLVKTAARQAAQAGLEVGLDCFSPALTRMVGQHLADLDAVCDWIKVMTYPRVFGPAGLSFELAALLDWLTGRGIAPAEALAALAESIRLPLPAAPDDLRQTGLGSETMQIEIERGRQMGVRQLLAGLALVEMPGVHTSTEAQIRAELEASRAADGLALSWDLWLTPLEYLDTIRLIWC